MWTTSDAVDSFLSNDAGKPSWDNFPVLCTHRHAWPLFSLTKLAGVNFNGPGLALTPAPLPRYLLCGGTASQEGSNLLWSLETPSFSVFAYLNGTWRGDFRVMGSLASFHAILPLQVHPCVDREENRRAFGVRAVLAWVTVRSEVEMEASKSEHAVVRGLSATESAAWASAGRVSAVVEFNISLPFLHASSYPARVAWVLDVA